MPPGCNHPYSTFTPFSSLLAKLVLRIALAHSVFVEYLILHTTLVSKFMVERYPVSLSSYNHRLHRACTSLLSGFKSADRPEQGTTASSTPEPIEGVLPLPTSLQRGHRSCVKGTSRGEIEDAADHSSSAGTVPIHFYHPVLTMLQHLKMQSSQANAWVEPTVVNSASPF